MGQRHMTYVIVSDPEINDWDVRCLHNQWNSEAMQPHKAMRFLAAVRTWQRHRASESPPHVCALYEAAAAVTPDCYCNSVRIDPMYRPGFGMYGEDNNNGWQIVDVRLSRDKRRGRLLGDVRYDVSIGFKPGYEWGADWKAQPYLSVSKYLDGYYRRREEHYRAHPDPTRKTETLADYLSQFGPRRLALFNALDASWDADRMAAAERRIRAYVEWRQRRNPPGGDDDPGRPLGKPAGEEPDLLKIA